MQICANKIQTIAIFCFWLVLLQCTNQEGKVVDTWDDGSVKAKKIFLSEKDTAQYVRLTYYRSGQVEGHCRYLGNIKNGWGISFHENGRVKDSLFYRDNFPVTVAKSFFSNGTLALIGQFNESGKKDGEWFYYDSAGRVTEQSSFVHDEKLVSTFFDTLGWMIRKVRYFEGANGLPEEVLNYKDSVLHGRFIRFSGNGNLSVLGKYMNGEKDSIWTEYYGSGIKYKEYIFEKDYGFAGRMLNIWEERGAQIVKNGNGTHITFEYCSNGKVGIRITKKYVNGFSEKEEFTRVNRCI